MVPKSVIDVSIIWLNDDIYSRNTWFPTTDVQTQNIGKLRYANRRTPTECRHTVATQATEYQRWCDVGCRSRRCRPMPTLGQRRNASWDVIVKNIRYLIWNWVFKISARPSSLTSKIWVGHASCPSLSYIIFGKIVLQSGKFQILFWRLLPCFHNIYIPNISGLVYSVYLVYSVHRSFMWFLLLNWRKSTFYRSQVLILFQNI